MKIQYSIYALLLVLLISCAEKKYKRTRKIPNSDLYVEVFTANSWGLNQEYLTDSATFRMFVGTVDEEHDYFTYQYQSDSIYIKKILTGNKNCRWVTTKDSLQTVLCDTEQITRKPISLMQLMTKKEFE